MSKEKFYLGLDIGTNSVGWAVTDKRYNLVRRMGQDLWGVRKFESAENADKRRTNRSSRRNLQRRKQRIFLLNEIFKEELNKFDKGFLQRLKESQLYKEDKTSLQKNTLFDDRDFNDKDFHNKYPTIYHLIIDLIENGTKDIRLLYLAIHKLLKNRGHFLFEGLEFNVSNMNDSQNERILLEQLNTNIINSLNNYNNEDIESNGREYIFDFEGKDEKVFDILGAKIGIKDKQNKLVALLNINTKSDIGKVQKTMIDALVGSTAAKLHILFQNEKLKEESNNNIELDMENFENYLDEVLPIIDLEGVELLKSLKKVFDLGILKSVLRGSKLISYAMKDSYEEHKKDLKNFKQYVRKHHSAKEYKQMFKDSNQKAEKDQEKDKSFVSYANYIATSKTNCHKIKLQKKTQEDFYKFVKKFVSKVNSPDKDWILEKIEKGDFLQKQTIKLNSAIPNQLKLAELKLVLDKNKDNFSFLNEIDKNSFSNYDKLLKICSFRIPYYIGPLNNAHKVEDGGFSWVEKHEGKEFEKITPWNFDEIVDKEKTKKMFFKNLISNCTYLPSEKVLPKNSLLNSKHIILNTINKIKLNYKPITIQEKQELFKFLIKEKKITKKVIEKYFINSGKKSNIEGIDIDLNISYPAYSRIKDILKEKVEYDKDFDLLEEIILDLTMATDSNSVNKNFKNKYKDRFTFEEINKLSLIKLSDWGRLSRKFLNEIISVDKETGEVMTIIDALYNTNYNLNELPYNDFGFMKVVDMDNEEEQKRIGIEPTLYEKVKNLYVSNPVKRQIWQSLLLVNELKEMLDISPDKIFVEMARGADGQGRTKSRKRQLIDLYNNIKDEKRDWMKELFETEDSKLKSEKFFLYYTQMGKCAYSGKPINLTELDNRNLYDIDHIYPQSKIKDDSVLANKVLVLKEENQNKLDRYPISSEVRKSMGEIWKYWLDKGLIINEKYKRLVRNVGLTQDECAEFINRQLVETRQSTKIVANLLNDIFSDAKIVYSKARNVIEFKDFARDDKNPNKTELFTKVREINDLHHAKDAYLNIVVGNVYNTKFGYNAKDYLEKRGEDSYNLNNLFKYPTKGAWDVDKEKNSFEIIKNNYRKNTCLVTDMNLEKSGGFYDQQLKRKAKNSGKDNSLLPIKTGENFLSGKLMDTSKYGGYGGVKNAYIALVKFTKNKKVHKRLEFVPVLISTLIKQDKLTLKEYFKSQFEADEIKILLPKIKMRSLFKIDGSFVLLTGTTSGQIKWVSANQPFFDEENSLYIRKIVNFKKKLLENTGKEIKVNEKYDSITKEKNIHLYDKFIEKFNARVFKNLKMPDYAERLLNKKEKFTSLNEEEQTKLLYEIIMILSPNATLGNLSLIGESSFAGSICSTQDIDKYDEIKLINTSITGIKRKEINLKKLN